MKKELRKNTYHNDDITFCANGSCRITSCDRHLNNYRGYKIYISIADLEGTVYCVKKELEK